MGTNGPDRLVGTGRRDVICGLGGADVLVGRGGDDVLSGGPGNDYLLPGTGRDRALGDAGNDFVGARDGHADRIFGGPGADRARVDPRLDTTGLRPTRRVGAAPAGADTGYTIRPWQSLPTTSSACGPAGSRSTTPRSRR